MLVSVNLKTKFSSLIRCRWILQLIIEYYRIVIPVNKDSCFKANVSINIGCVSLRIKRLVCLYTALYTFPLLFVLFINIKKRWISFDIITEEKHKTSYYYSSLHYFFLYQTKGQICRKFSAGALIPFSIHFKHVRHCISVCKCENVSDCLRAYVRVFVNLCECLRVCSCQCECVWIYACECLYVCEYLCGCTYQYVGVGVCVCVCARAFVYLNMFWYPRVYEFLWVRVGMYMCTWVSWDEDKRQTIKN